MKGKPKVGEVWVVRRDGETEFWWLYQIVAVVERQGGACYVGLKDNGVSEPFSPAAFPVAFDHNGRDLLNASYHLVRRSRQRRLFDDSEVVPARLLPKA